MLFSHWPIRNKLQVGLGLLAVSVLTLFGSAYYGLYAYRGLVKSLSARSAELPLADQLRDSVAGLHEIINQARARQQLEEKFEPLLLNAADQTIWDVGLLHQRYSEQLDLFRQTLVWYRSQLDLNRLRAESGIGDDHHEQKTLEEIDKVVPRMAQYHDENVSATELFKDEEKLSRMHEDVEHLRRLAAELPSHLHERLRDLSSNVRNQYRWAISLAWVTAGLATILLAAAVQLFRKWIAYPLATLVQGSREVAAGKFDHRIHLNSNDEMGELAVAMNAMTARFREIRDDLDRQVRERTKQVVRSEQLASVGFLAAGVAHEINNPLASIAMCSESLEGRLSDLLKHVDEERAADREVVCSYLDMIQKEAFRCKQITEKLLDFSRMGDSERHLTDLRELAADVIEMLRLGKYQNKNAVLRDGGPVLAEVSPQEIRQVVLNLLTNGLDSVEPHGTVTIAVSARDEHAQIVVEDNGCGMTEDVLQHLFEPFFTRRRGGQGTGLGLSISYRIVEEHHGTITARSDGAGKGATFTVTLPLRQPATRHKPPIAA